MPRSVSISSTRCAAFNFSATFSDSAADTGRDRHF
jgi:hypothetical protein